MVGKIFTGRTQLSKTFSLDEAFDCLKAKREYKTDISKCLIWREAETGKEVGLWVNQ